MNRLVCLCILLLPACAPTPQPHVSVEQTAGDTIETPAPERRAHLAKLGVTRWHDNGVRGQGVKVAVLDSGFRGYRRFLGKGLPADVRTRSFRRDRDLEARDSQHGILCAEIIHTLAPDAQITLVNWEPDSPKTFVDAVRWARADGAKILSCSLIMPTWSDGEGGGATHRELAPLIKDALFFASAGNTATRHWCGPFHPNDEGWHRWHADAIGNALTPWGTDPVAVELYGPTRSLLEVSVYDAESGDAVGRARLQVDGTGASGWAVVRFQPNPRALYEVRIRSLNTPHTKVENFHVIVRGASLQMATPRGSIAFPGDGERVLAVGAADVEDRRVYYSSCGPNSRLPKPDFMATVPFQCACRAAPFTGTSAAAPQAAGLAALLWSHRPTWTAEQVSRALRQAARDLGPPGHDHETGYGLIRLPETVSLGFGVPHPRASSP